MIWWLIKLIIMVCDKGIFEIRFLGDETFVVFDDDGSDDDNKDFVVG